MMAKRDNCIFNAVEESEVDGKIVLDSFGCAIWELHTEVSDKRKLFKSKDVDSLNQQLKCPLGDTLWKFHLVIPNTKVGNFYKFHDDWGLFKKAAFNKKSMEDNFMERFEVSNKNPRVTYVVNN